MIEVQEHEPKPLTVFAMKRKIKQYNAAHAKKDMGDLDDAANFLKGLNWPILANFAFWVALLVWLV
jgi:hypothetical protein